MNIRNNSVLEIAQEISNNDLFEMFKSASVSIQNWNEPSRYNPFVSKGFAWDVLAKKFDIKKNYSVKAKLAMIIEFYQYLPEPIKSKISEYQILHIEPDFSNYKVENEL